MAVNRSSSMAGYQVTELAKTFYGTRINMCFRLVTWMLRTPYSFWAEGLVRVPTIRVISILRMKKGERTNVRQSQPKADESLCGSPVPALLPMRDEGCCEPISGSTGLVVSQTFWQTVKRSSKKTNP